MNRPIGALLLGGLLLASPVAATAVPPRMPPADWCRSEPGFAAFRRTLLQAVDRRDSAYLLSAVSDEISFGPAEGRGRDAFARYWGLADPARSPLWAVLGQALRMGCTYDEARSLWAPSMSVIGNEDLGEDYSIRRVVVGREALRRGPSSRRAVAARLHWDVVTVTNDDGRSLWLRVALADGRTGYVRRSGLRGFDAAAVGFARVSGQWRLVAMRSYD